MTTLRRSERVLLEVPKNGCFGMISQCTKVWPLQKPTYLKMKKLPELRGPHLWWEFFSRHSLVDRRSDLPCSWRDAVAVAHNWQS